MILGIVEKGKNTLKLHASVLLRDVFGPLTEDKEEFFPAAKFKK